VQYFHVYCAGYLANNYWWNVTFFARVIFPVICGGDGSIIGFCVSAGA
jgi:hypothetical protein